MPWVPKGKEVKRRRSSVGLTSLQLARRAGISDRALRSIESEEPPATVRSSTVTALAKALGCEPVDLATWNDRTAARRAPERVRAILGPKEPASARVAPHMRVIAERAIGERERGLHEQTIEVAGATYPLLGLNAFIECDARYADYGGRVFAVAGKVTQYRRITSKVGTVLGAERGRGAAYFCLERQISDGIAFHATVFAPKAEHGRALIDRAKKDAPIICLARVRVADYDEKTGWKGFFIFEEDEHPWPWALVVERVVAGDG